MTKCCSRCGLTKSRAEFGPNKGRKDGLTVYCRPCTKEYMADKTYDKQRWEERREAEHKRNKAYRENNKDRLNEKSRAAKKAYREQNPEVIRARNVERKAKQKRAMPVWVDRGALRRIYAECQQLNTRYGANLQVDHVVPIRSKLVCGLHVPANLQLMDATLNDSKGNRYWPDMPGEQGAY